MLDSEINQRSAAETQMPPPQGPGGGGGDVSPRKPAPRLPLLACSPLSGRRDPTSGTQGSAVLIHRLRAHGFASGVFSRAAESSSGSNLVSSPE